MKEGLISNYSSGSGGMAKAGSVKNRGFRKVNEPCHTLTSKCLSMTWHPSGLSMSMVEALVFRDTVAIFGILIACRLATRCPPVWHVPCLSRYGRNPSPLHHPPTANRF